MNLFDIGCCLILLISIAVFYKKGISGVVLPVLALLGSIFFAIYLGDEVRGIFNFNLNPALAGGLSYAITFTFALAVLSLLTFLLKQFIANTPLKILDSILGGGFGLIIAFLIFSFAVMLKEEFGFMKRTIEGSHIVYPLVSALMK